MTQVIGDCRVFPDYKKNLDATPRVLVFSGQLPEDLVGKRHDQLDDASNQCMKLPWPRGNFRFHFFRERIAQDSLIAKFLLDGPVSPRTSSILQRVISLRYWTRFSLLACFSEKRPVKNRSLPNA